MSGRVLVVDDEVAMVNMLVAQLGQLGYEANAFTDAESAFAALRTSDYDVVLTDLNMKPVDGLTLCARVGGDREDIPVVVMTAFGDYDAAVGALRAGAYDFISKPFERAGLEPVVARAIEHRRLRAEVRRLRAATSLSAATPLGASRVMRDIEELVQRVAATNVTVLVCGESGTGKEVVAKALHAASPRRDAPLICVNCAALPEALLESELFGHVRGAFTDARATRAGLFAQADGGTLFLDEVGELPVALQPKLLRVLQEQTFRPLGGEREHTVDVRVIAATNRDLGSAVAQQTFREDLYYRLDVVRIDLPPLRVRGNDILELAHLFLRRAAAKMGKRVDSLSRASAERLLAYSWPGNVRELQNCIERAVALTPYETISVEDLPDRLRSARLPELPGDGDVTDLPRMEEVERRYIERVMSMVGGNKSSAARILGYDRTTLYRKLERYGL
jgi:two-component system, NtrC family, response regulator AtoC